MGGQDDQVAPYWILSRLYPLLPIAVRLLILTQYYPPETGAPQNRLSDLARRFDERGHEVEILTALPNYPTNQILPGYEGRENEHDAIDGIRVARVGLHVPKDKSTKERIRCYVSFAMNALWHGPRLVSRPDVILMESPPLTVALAGVRLARYFSAPLVSNISDLWPASVVELGLAVPAPMIWGATRMEHWMYNRSALVFGQTDGIVENIRARVETPVRLFPNGVDLDAYDGVLRRDAVRERFGWEPGQFVVGYAGVLGMAQALDQVLDAAVMVRDLPDLHIAVFGDGPERERLVDRVEREAITNVTLYGRQPREEMPHIQAAVDASLVPLAKGPLFEGARPSKMFEIMAAARPLVVCACGEAAAITEAAPGGAAGVVVPPEEPAKLAQALRWLQYHREEAAVMGKRGCELARTHFDRSQIALQIEAILECVVRREPISED